VPERDKESREGMAAGVLITIREGLEAFLITGILLAYLRKVGQPGLAAYVWTGTGAGIVVSARQREPGP